MGTASVRADDLVVGGQRVELQLTSISACTLRVSLLPIAPDGSVQAAAELIRTGDRANEPAASQNSYAVCAQDRRLGRLQDSRDA